MAELEPVVDVDTTGAFADIARSTVTFLASSSPVLDLWLVSRVRDDQQQIIASSGPWARGMRAGWSLPWASTLSVHMVSGRVPTATGDVWEVPRYRSAAVGVHARVRAYAGTPVRLPDGELFGTVCGFAGTTIPRHRMQGVKPRLDALGNLLGEIASLSRRIADLGHAPCSVEYFFDQCDLEEARGRQFGVRSSLVVIDLTASAGRHAASQDPESWSRLCAAVLRRVCLPCDCVTQLDTHTFAVLAVEADSAAVRALGRRLRARLTEAGLDAEVGFATRWRDEPVRRTLDRAVADLRRPRGRGALRPVPDGHGPEPG